MEAHISNDTFYRSRSLVGRLSEAFKLLNKNMLTVIRPSLYILIPLCAIQAIASFIVEITGGTVELTTLTYVLMSVIMIVTILGSCLFSSYLYTILHNYAEKGYLPVVDNLKPIWPSLLKNARKVFLTGLVIVFVFTIYVVLAIAACVHLTLYTLLLTIPLFIFLLIPAIYLGFIYVFENITLWMSIKKSVKMGIRNWGGTFTVFLFSGIIGGFVQVVFLMPWAIGVVVGAFANQATLLGDPVTLPAFYPYLMILLSFVSGVGVSLSAFVSFFPLAFQYGSAEASDKDRVMWEIDNLSAEKE